MDEQPLEHEQLELLAQLVGIYQSLPREKRQDFVYQEALTRVGGARSLSATRKVFEDGGVITYQGQTWYSLADVPKNYDQDFIVHPESVSNPIAVLQHDIDALLYHDLVRLRDKDHLFITPKGIKLPAEQQSGAVKKDKVQAQSMDKLIFISHKETDVKIAKKLVDFLLAALEVKDNEVLCTSVPGHMLSYGLPIPEQLRDGLITSAVLIALLTENSVSATWVLFELGAAWGLKKLVIPLLGPGLAFKDFRGPLNDIPGVQITADNASVRLMDAVKQIAHELAIEEKSGGKTLAAMNDFIKEFVALPLVVPENNYATRLTEEMATEVFSEADCMLILEDWLLNRSGSGVLVERFIDVDKSADLPPGSAKLYLETAARKLDWNVDAVTERAIRIDYRTYD